MPMKFWTEQSFAAHFVIFAQRTTLLLLLVSGAYPVCAQQPQTDYYYQQEQVAQTSGRSCSAIFREIHTGKGEDVGGVVKSLKAINVQYLLEDYDDALSRDRRKKDYVQLDQLLREIARNKREIYCKIELALYLQSHEEFAGPAYADLLAEAFAKLEATYASATKSFERGDFERALYAFDLIAPYKDADRLYRQVAEKQRAVADEELVAAAEVETAEDELSGSIALALRAGWQDKSMAVQKKEPGPIALASRMGPITSALQALEEKAIPE